MQILKRLLIIAVVKYFEELQGAKMAYNNRTGIARDIERLF